MKYYSGAATWMVVMVIFSAILNLSAANLITASTTPTFQVSQFDATVISLQGTPLTKDAPYMVFTGQIDTLFWKSHWDDILFRFDFGTGFHFSEYTIITNSTKKSETYFETHALNFTGTMGGLPQILTTISWPLLDDDVLAKTTRSFELIFKIKKLDYGVDADGFKIRKTSYLRANKDAKVKQEIDADVEYPFAKTIGKLHANFKKIHKKNDPVWGPYSELSFKLAEPLLPRDSRHHLVFLNRLNSTSFETDAALDAKGVAQIECTLNNAPVTVQLDTIQSHFVVKMEDAKKVAEKKTMLFKCPAKQLRVLHPKDRDAHTSYALEVRDTEGQIWTAVDQKEAPKVSNKTLGLIALIALVLVAIIVVVLLKVFKLACFKPNPDNSESLLDNTIQSQDGSYQEF